MTYWWRSVDAVFDNRLSFAHSDDVYSLMENIVTVAVPEIHFSDNNGVSTTYPSLNRFCQLTTASLPPTLHLTGSVNFCHSFVWRDWRFIMFLPTHRCAGAICAVVLCLSVRLSQVGSSVKFTKQIQLVVHIEAPSAYSAGSEFRYLQK